MEDTHDPNETPRLTPRRLRAVAPNDHQAWSEPNVKLSVMQENLARGLSVVSRAVSNRSTLPVLANVLLKTEDAGLKLTATNLEIGITYWVPGKIETDGATTVPAKLLTDLVNSLPAGDRVDLALQAGDTLHLACGRFETHIKGIDADEFPAIGAAGERPTTRIAQNVLRRALAETAFAAASDEARPILTGVLARFEGDQLDAGSSRQLPDRGQDHPDPRRGARDERGHPGARAQRARADPRRRRRPGRGRPGRWAQPGAVPPRWDRPRQPPDRRPVPELPAGRPTEPLDAGGARSRGAAARGPAGGPHRPRVGQHREAPDQRRRRTRDHGQRQRGGRRPRRPGRGRGRGRRHDDRLQRPLPGRRPDQRAGRPVRARAQRSALARACSSRSATTATSTWSCPSGPPPEILGPTGSRGSASDLGACVPARR